MKTFKQFYVEAYQLNELDLKGTLQSASRNPLINNPVTRTLGKGVGLVNRLTGIPIRAAATVGAVDPEAGPIQRAFRSSVLFSPPGVAQLLATQTGRVDNSPTRKKLDAAMMRTDKKVQQAVGQYPKPGSGQMPNYARAYYNAQQQGQPLF